MQDVISTETSQTAMACEQAALFGATPGPDEFDNREIWNEDEALAGIEEAIHILAGAVAPDGNGLRTGRPVRRHPWHEFDNREIWNEDERSPTNGTERSSPTNARASSGASSIRCTPRSSASTGASTRSRPR